MDKKKTVTLTVRLTPEMSRKLGEAAEKSHRSKNGLILSLLDEYFRKEGIK